jgi:hypothetical protein
MPRSIAISLGITFTALGLVWHFRSMRQRIAHEVRGVMDKNKVSVIHQQSEQCKRAAFIEGAVLLVGLSVLNALDERYLPGGYPFGSRLLFNVCMAMILTVIFFVGRQCCIHCRQPARAKNNIKPRKL